jgi:hypothetical protein
VPASVVQLELGMHRAVVTVLEHGGEFRRARYELLPQCGWLALHQAWLDMIAAAFVRRTRFDPLHEATHEQRLWDGLPQWLATLEREPQVAIEIQSPSDTHTVDIPGEQFAAAAERVYDAVLYALQRTRPVGAPLHVRLSHRWAGLPGFAAHLAELRDCEVVHLPRGAAALGALAYEESLRREPAALVLVQRLPVPLRGSAAPAVAAIPPADRPTHVVHSSRAWAIRTEPLAIGTSVPPGQRAIGMPPGPGISRVHCTLARGDDGVWLEDLSTYGTYVNGERIGSRVALRAGDRLRLGNPGVELELVRTVDDDGAA